MKYWCYRELDGFGFYSQQVIGKQDHDSVSIIDLEGQALLAEVLPQGRRG